MDDSYRADEQSMSYDQSMDKSPVPPPRNKGTGGIAAGAPAVLSDLGDTSFSRSSDSPLSNRPMSAPLSPDDKRRNNNQSNGSSSSNSVNGSASVDYYGNEDFEEEDEEAFKPPAAAAAEKPPPKKDKPKLFMNTEAATSKENANKSQSSNSFLDATFENESDSDRSDHMLHPAGGAGKGKATTGARDPSAAGDVFVMEDIEEESVASEDIDGFNISHSSAGSHAMSMSDSFASLVNDSMNSQGLKHKGGKKAINVPVVGAVTSIPPPKPHRSRESNLMSSTNSLEDSHRSFEDSHRSNASEGMEFSMNEVEISNSSAGGAGSKLDGYDFQTAALPPLKEEKRPKRRERDGGLKSGW